MRRLSLLIASLLMVTSVALVGTRDLPGWGATGAAESEVASGVVLADNGGWVVGANADGSGVRTLTAPLSGLGDSDPVASPDGSLIAFVRDLDRVKVMRPDGSGLRDVGEGTTSPAWAPDGTLLAYGSGPFGITVVRPDGSDRRLLVSDNEWFGFTWSPDATSIAYASSNGISVVNVHTRERRLLFKQEHAWRPAWSPDGSQIAFLGSLGKGKDSVERVLVMNADGSGVRPVGPTPNAETPAWSPDGTRVAFGETASGEPGGVVVVDVPTGLVTTRIPPFGGGPSAVPSWSPDGTRIAFLRSSEAKTYADYNGDVWVARADGSIPVQVTRLFPLGGSSSVPRWLPAVAAITPDAPIATAALPATTWQQLGRRYLIAAVDRTAVALVPDRDGPSASASANKLGIWDHRGAVSWVATGKLPAHNAALAGRRVYWSYWGTDRYRLTLSGLWTATWPHGRIMRLRYLSGEREGHGITVEGDRSLVVYTLGRSLWRLQGNTARRIRREDTELKPLSVNAGRALIANGSRRLEVIGPSGRLLASLPKPQGYVWARLSGNRLLVLTDSKIRVYELPGGRLRSTRPVGAIGSARQAGFPWGSLFPYQTKQHMHLLDVDTGQDKIFTVHDELSPASVGITSAGLVYTAAHPYAGINGEVGLVPLASLRPATKYGSLADAATTSNGCRWQTMRVKKGVEWLSLAQTSRNDVWLAGDRWLDKYQVKARGIVEHWNGRRWRTEVLPSNQGVSGVASASASNAWTLLIDPTGRQRITHWDGRRWTFVGPSRYWPAFSDIAALPNGEAWVAAHAGLILHWNGRRWQRMKAPRDQGWLADYNAVVARSVKDVWALGFRGSRKGWRTHALHWDGTSWRVVPTPDLVNDGGRAEDVGEVLREGQIGRDGSLYAIGNTGGGRPVIERWDGKRWKVVSLPAPRATSWLEIGSIVLRSPADIWAADAANKSPRLYHWNGHTWSNIAVPTALRSAHELSLHVAAGDMWMFSNLAGDGIDRLAAATRLQCGS